MSESTAKDHCETTTRDQLQSDSETESWSVNDILQRFGPAYLTKYQDRMSLDQIKTLHARQQGERLAGRSTITLVAMFLLHDHVHGAQGVSAVHPVSSQRVLSGDLRRSKIITDQAGQGPSIYRLG